MLTYLITTDTFYSPPAPEDYTSISATHTFTPGGDTRRCSSIPITSDTAVESSETFSAGLTSEVDILDTPISAFILILDSSSKYNIRGYSKHTTVLQTACLLSTAESLCSSLVMQRAYVFNEVVYAVSLCALSNTMS